MRPRPKPNPESRPRPLFMLVWPTTTTWARSCSDGGGSPLFYQDLVVFRCEFREAAMAAAPPSFVSKPTRGFLFLTWSLSYFSFICNWTFNSAIFRTINRVSLQYSESSYCSSTLYFGILFVFLSGFLKANKVEFMLDGNKNELYIYLDFCKKFVRCCF